MLFLDDDLLRVGDYDIEIRVIQGVKRCARIIKEVHLHIRIKNPCVFGRNDKSFIKGYNFFERLQYRFVGCEHKCIVAKTVILGILVGKQKLIEDTSSHQNSFSETHGKCIDIVWVYLGDIFHHLEYFCSLLLSKVIKQLNLPTFIN